jgi:hypothetical protein
MDGPYRQESICHLVEAGKHEKNEHNKVCIQGEHQKRKILLRDKLFICHSLKYTVSTKPLRLYLTRCPGPNHLSVPILSDSVVQSSKIDIPSC